MPASEYIAYAERIEEEERERARLQAEADAAERSAENGAMDAA